MDRAIGVLREALVVCDHANRSAAGVKFLQQLHYRFAIARIKIASRLVGQENRGLAGERACDCYALLLAARELAWQMFRAMRHAHALQSSGDKRFAFACAHASISKRQLDVLEHCEIANQIKTLENKADLAIANARTVGKRKISNLVCF